MAFLPLAIQLLPMIPSLIDNVLKIVNAVRQDPMTPEVTKVELAVVSARLQEVVEHVKQVRLPA